MTRKDWAAVGVVVVVSILFTWLIIGTGFRNLRDGNRLIDHGRDGVAQVDWAWGRSRIKISWWVRGHRYELADGGSGGRYSKGDTIMIRLLAEDPSVGHFDWVGLRQRGLILVSVAPVVLALFILVAWFEIRRSILNRARSGSPKPNRM